jgi:hypothetical protein
VSVVARGWKWWRRIAHRAARFQSNVLLFVVYFLVVVPLALLFRMAGRSEPPGWRAIPLPEPDLDSGKSQY